ncbi:Ankyrin repeat-containing domain [Phytophthora cactorum]|nr:Ankyrin repeat-containing domain [Phytophthora cactorum]
MGWTPLHIACFKGFPDLVEYLLVRHARIDVEDCYGFTPMMFARFAENMDVVKSLDDFVRNKRPIDCENLQLTSPRRRRRSGDILSQTIVLSAKN